MTRMEIHDLLAEYRINGIEMEVLSECTPDMEARRQYLAKRLTLVEHWLRVLTEKEQKVLRCHLMEGKSWAKIADESFALDLPSDERALQRIQRGALLKLERFTAQGFGDSLDYLARRVPVA